MEQECVLFSHRPSAVQHALKWPVLVDVVVINAPGRVALAHGENGCAVGGFVRSHHVALHRPVLCAIIGSCISCRYKISTSVEAVVDDLDIFNDLTCAWAQRHCAEVNPLNSNVACLNRDCPEFGVRARKWVCDVPAALEGDGNGNNGIAVTQRRRQQLNDVPRGSGFKSRGQGSVLCRTFREVADGQYVLGTRRTQKAKEGQ